LDGSAEGKVGVTLQVEKSIISLQGEANLGVGVRKFCQVGGKFGKEKHGHGHADFARGLLLVSDDGAFGSEHGCLDGFSAL